MSRRVLAFLAGLLLGTQGLAAQALEPSSLGLQLRGSLPQGDLHGALGGSSLPGLGLSLFAEVDLEGLRGRLEVGGDRWIARMGSGSRDLNISAVHLGVEAVYFLRDIGPHPVLGPYLLVGLGAYAWTLGKDVQNRGEARQVTHGAFTLGFGVRLARQVDAEVKFLQGPLDGGLKATAWLGGVNLRY